MLYCLGDPMRCRILEVVNEHPMSPVQFIRYGLAGTGWPSHQDALSRVSYHFRVLEKAGAVEVIEVNQRRGATEHVFRGNARVHFTSEEFETFPEGKRAELTRVSLQGFFARTDSAVTTGTFDKRANRHLSWQAMTLDEKGFEEITHLLDDTLGEAQNILHRACERLAAGPNDSIPTTLGLFAYESPVLPPLD